MLPIDLLHLQELAQLVPSIETTPSEQHYWIPDMLLHHHHHNIIVTEMGTGTGIADRQAQDPMATALAMRRRESRAMVMEVAEDIKVNLEVTGMDRTARTTGKDEAVVKVVVTRTVVGL